MIIKFNSLIWLKEINTPKWNDNPFSLRNPLVLFQFFAYFFVAVGLCVMLGDLIRYHELNPISLQIIGYGAGIFIGIGLTLLWMGGKGRAIT